MKISLLMIVAIFTLFSASAYAASYTCTASNAAGIYDLTLDAGTATLRVDGTVHTATGAGEYFFSESFALGDVVFNSPTLSVPMDGSTSEIQFTATLSDGAGAFAELNCSH